MKIEDEKKAIACEFIDLLNEEIDYLERISHHRKHYTDPEVYINIITEKNTINTQIIKLTAIAMAFALYNNNPDVFRKTLENTKKGFEDERNKILSAVAKKKEE